MQKHTRLQIIKRFHLFRGNALVDVYEHLIGAQMKANRDSGYEVQFVEYPDAGRWVSADYAIQRYVDCIDI